MAVTSGSSRRYDPDDEDDGGFWSRMDDFFSGDIFPEGSVGARLAGRGPSVGAELRSQAGRAWDAVTDTLSGPGRFGPASAPFSLYQGAQEGLDRVRDSGIMDWYAEHARPIDLFGDNDRPGANDLRAQNPLGQGGGPSRPERPEAPKATDYVGPPPQGSAAAPQVPTGPDPFAQIDEAQSRAAAQLSALDDQYEERLAELRERYEFSETPEEKAQIQFLLGDLEQRRDAGKQAIQTVYEEAIADATERSGAMREEAEETGQQVGDLYRQAAQDTATIFEDMNEEQDSAFGVGGEQMSDRAKDWVAVMEAASPREQAAAQQTGELAAEDVEHLGQAMNEQEAARLAALERLAMQMETSAQMQHDRRVQDRVNAERMRFADQAGGLRQQFDQRGYRLQDQITDLGTQAAGMAQDARMQNAQMQQQASIANQRAQQSYQDRRQQAAMQDAEHQYQRDMMAWLRQERERVVQEIMQRDDIDSLDEAIALAQMQYPELFE